MTPRRPPNLSEKVEVLTAQAFCGCRDCRVAMAKMIRVYGNIWGEQAIPQRLVAGAVEYHHADERAAGGADHPDNYLALTKECHARETNKPGGSKAKVARSKRLELARAALNFAALTPAAQQQQRAVLGEQPYMKARHVKKTVTVRGREYWKTGKELERDERNSAAADAGLLFPKPVRKRSKWKIPTRKKRT